MEPSRHGTVDPIAVPGVPRAHVLRHAALEALMFDRNVIGTQFAESCRTATEAMLFHLRDAMTGRLEDGAVAELALLSKGLCYSVGVAFHAITGCNLPMNMAATRRETVGEGEATIGVPYFNFDAGGSRLIIGDTVATGATVCTALDVYREHWDIDAVHLLTIAGSVVGAQTIAAYCSRHNIELTITFGLAAFGLARNGFDLAFQHPQTITDPSYVHRANNVFHDRPVSSVGWDFGSQAQAPRKYRQLCWLERKYWELEDTDVFLDVEEPTPETTLVSKEYSAFLAPREG
jgi:hypothetical protein